MNWHSLVIIGIIVILFIILMIINATATDLDQDNGEENSSVAATMADEPIAPVTNQTNTDNS